MIFIVLILKGFKGDAQIGHDVWIGKDAVFMPGESVCSGAIIATRSVITKDVPPYAIVGGNPAQLIRYRFEPAVIELLLQLACWDWPVAKLTPVLPAILSGDLQQLQRLVASQPDD
jgi:virginiamycin A acetyltransferase